MNRHFCFVDDAQRVRWAVRLSQPFQLRAELGDHTTRIVFTSAESQISTIFPLQKEEQELTMYELLELLAHAQREALGNAYPAALA